MILPNRPFEYDGAYHFFGEGRWGYRGRVLGSSKSGHYGHAGIPGQVGGSMAKGMALHKQLVGELQPMPSDPFASPPRDWDMMSRLASETGVDDQKVFNITEEWNKNSSEDSYPNLALQQDAADLFGKEMPQRLIDAKKAIDDEIAQRRERGLNKIADILENTYATPEERKALLTSMRDETQKRIAGLGYNPNDTITLYRGVSTDAAAYNKGTLPYSWQPLESWTASYSIAELYSKNRANVLDATPKYGAIVKVTVPVKDIVSVSSTGLGFGHLDEFVISSQGNVQIVDKVQNLSELSLLGPNLALSLQEMGYEKSIEYLIEHDYHFRTDGQRIAILGGPGSDDF